MSQVMTAVKEKRAENKQIEEALKDKKLPVKENRHLAKRILALVVAFSILFVGGVKLNSKRSKAINVFKTGTSSEYLVSVYNDIQESATSASILAGIAQAKLGDTDEVSRLSKLASKILKEDDESELVELFTELVQISNTVYSLYEEAAGEASTDAVKAIRNINSARTTVSNDAYWKYASEFNDARSGFPAWLIALLSGAKKLPDKLG